jgi:hypothetical protein
MDFLILAGLHIKHLQIFQATNIISAMFLGARNNGDLRFARQEILRPHIGLKRGIFSIFGGQNKDSYF